MLQINCLIKFRFLLIIIVSFSLILPVQIYGLEGFDNENMIIITESEDIDQVVFDGKWTFDIEWKKSSWTKVEFDDKNIYHLRTAHDRNFIYIMFNVVDDKTSNVGKDKATVCIDSKNNKNKFLDEDDFCFIVKLQGDNFFSMFFDEKNNLILQGDKFEMEQKDLNEISVNDFIGIGVMSDKEDRYSKTPHTTYEFKIPTELVGRSDNYGFYVSVYDSDSGHIYSWPESIKLDSYKIPSPALWGDLVSPDKSLPEFEFPLLVILSALVAIILISRFKTNKIQRVYE